MPQPIPAPQDIPEHELPESPLPYPTVLTERAAEGRLSARRALEWSRREKERCKDFPRVAVGVSGLLTRHFMAVNTTAEISRVEWGIHAAAYEAWVLSDDPQATTWECEFQGERLRVNRVPSATPGVDMLSVKLTG